MYTRSVLSSVLWEFYSKFEYKSKALAQLAGPGCLCVPFGMHCITWTLTVSSTWIFGLYVGCVGMHKRNICVLHLHAWLLRCLLEHAY